MATIATLFSGGEGVGVGARAAGLTHLWGIEYDDKIASVARLNGFHSITADVMAVDPTGLEVPDVLHASPVCKRASNANQSAELNEDGTKEAPEDIAAGEKVAQFIEVMQPRIFTLENVYAYRNFKAFKIICATLSKHGYMWDFDNLNAADYGGWELCPVHHSVNYAGNHLVREIAPDIVAVSAMMQPDDQARILAWDVVANLDRTTQQDIAESAVWQRLAKEDNLEQIILTGRVDEALMNAGMLGLKYTDEINGNIAWLLRKCLDAPSVRPRWYIISTEIKRITVLKILQCFLATKSIFHTITNKEEYQSQNGKLGTSGIECPLCRYSAVPQTRRRLILRAVRGALLPNLPRPERWVGWYEAIEDLIPTLPESQFAKWQLERLPKEIKIGASDKGSCRAYLVGGGNTQLEQVSSKARDETQPAFTVFAGDNHVNRAWLSEGRIVRMTIRALCRFQSIPDDYKNPTYKIVGNAVPPLLYQKIIRQLI